MNWKQTRPQPVAKQIQWNVLRHTFRISAALIMFLWSPPLFPTPMLITPNAIASSSQVMTATRASCKHRLGVTWAKQIQVLLHEVICYTPRLRNTTMCMKMRRPMLLAYVEFSFYSCMGAWYRDAQEHIICMLLRHIMKNMEAYASDCVHVSYNAHVIVYQPLVGCMCTADKIGCAHA